MFIYLCILLYTRCNMCIYVYMYMCICVYIYIHIFLLRTWWGG